MTEETSPGVAPPVTPQVAVQHVTVAVAVSELVARAKERGVLTSAEVFAALRDLQPDTGELAAIYTQIEAAGVTVQDEIRDELELEDRQREEADSLRRRGGTEHRRGAPASPISRPGEASARRALVGD